MTDAVLDEVVVTPTRLEDLAELGAYLNQAFAQTDAAPFREVALRWKYLDAPATPASYVARRRGHLVGHIGLARRTMLIQRRGAVEPRRAAHFLDWVSTDPVGGTGGLLLLRALERLDLAFLIGGSAAGQQASLAAGFREVGRVSVMSRVVRARRPRFRQGGGLRAVATSVRDRWRQFAVQPRTPSRAIGLIGTMAFDDRISDLTRQASGPLATVLRTAPLLNHMLACPIVNVRGWYAHGEERILGAVLTSLARQGSEGRIIDCMAGSDDVGLWHAIFDSCTHELARQGAERVTAYASTALSEEAASRAGFARIDSKPLFIRDRSRGDLSDLPFYLTALEADHALW